MPRVDRRDDSLSRLGMDGANGPEHDLGGQRISLWLQVSAERLRCKSLHSVRRNLPSRRYQSGDIAAAESKFERALRALARSVKTELLSKLSLFGKSSLRHCFENYVSLSTRN